MASQEIIEKVYPDYQEAVPYEYPQPQRTPQVPEQPERKKKAKVLTRKEIMYLSVLSVLAFILIFGNLITQVMISNQNRSLQDLLVNNQQITVENGNLNQEVQELSRYNRIMEIAEELGLEMNEENVRNVSR